MKQGSFAWVVPALYILFLMTPIYWLVAMSFKTNLEITTRFTLFPETFNLDNYVKVFTDERWRAVFSNSLIYVGLNTVISIAVALPAAYAFSRYRFFGGAIGLAGGLAGGVAGGLALFRAARSDTSSIPSCSSIHRASAIARFSRCSCS